MAVFGDDTTHGAFHLIIIFTIFHPNKQDSELLQVEMRSKLSDSAQVSREAYDYFRYSFEFKASEISKNKKTIIDRKKPDFIGYVINAISKKTLEINAKKVK